MEIERYVVVEKSPDFCKMIQWRKHSADQHRAEQQKIDSKDVPDFPDFCKMTQWRKHSTDQHRAAHSSTEQSRAAKDEIQKVPTASGGRQIERVRGRVHEHYAIHVFASAVLWSVQRRSSSSLIRIVEQLTALSPHNEIDRCTAVAVAAIHLDTQQLHTRRL